jgi:hypothetical protein
MTTQNTNTTAAGKKRFVNVGIKYRGFLAHDNKYFDRTCPSCGNMYDSRVIALCPKCNQALTYITTPAGKPMTISEGTFYPLLSTKTKERITNSLARRKGAVPITYRFKIFSFMDDKGVLAPPPEHLNMKTGAIIELMMINHPAEATYFLTKTLKPGFELLHKIYPKYGDTIKVVRQPKAKAEAVIAYDVNADGTPAPVAPPYNPAEAKVDAAIKRIAELEKMLNIAPSAPVVPAPVVIEGVNAIKMAAGAAAAEWDDAGIDDGVDAELDAMDPDEAAPF